MFTPSKVYPMKLFSILYLSFVLLTLIHRPEHIFFVAGMYVVVIVLYSTAGK